MIHARRTSVTVGAETEVLVDGPVVLKRGCVGRGPSHLIE